MRDVMRRDPGLALLLLALVMAIALYAPTLTRGLINYDDPWLYHDNWIVRAHSWTSVRAIFGDLSPVTRYTLGAEYLPVRDLSVMLDGAIWGDWYPGYHATNLALYLGAIALWFAALDAFGIDRKLVGLALLLWAIHPMHAESVAWLSERKGLLGMMFAGASVLGYARFRAGRSAGWLVVAALTAIAAVWSKAPAAFAVASIAALELLLPARRVSMRRAFVGIGAIGAVAAAAFVPVLVVAASESVVGAASNLAASRAVSVIGFHGFYLRLAAMAIANAPSYPIAMHGPSALDLVVGGVGLAAVIGVLAVRRSPPALRVGAACWLLGWLPVSHLLLPVHTVALADRYLLFATLGFTLALAVGLARIPNPLGRRALIATIVVASALRTFDAQSSWLDTRTLWTRAVSSNPDDAGAWSELADDYAQAGDADTAMATADAGLQHVEAPRLLLRKALLLLARGDRDAGAALLRRAADGGEPKAMSNLALVQLAAGATDDAVAWARRGADALPTSSHAWRTLGKVELAAHHDADALAAFERAYALTPDYLGNRYNLALGLVATGRVADAIPHLEACVGDPEVGAAATAELAKLAELRR